MVVNQYFFITGAGLMQLTAINSPGSITLKNNGYSGNASSGTTITNGSVVTPSGPEGPTGATGISALNGVSPTTTKGDLMVDNGSNSPSASVVRLGVGTNGKALVADSTQASGLNYATITPDSVANAGDIAVFSASTGTPTPVGDSLMFIDATGALQNLHSSPNTRGTSAVDLQPVRGSSANVASGNNSTLGGGQSNTASGANAVVAGGTTNVASQTNSTVSGGTTNQATAVSSSIAGGNGNTASGQGSFAVGESNTASGTDSEVSGNGNIASANYSTAKGLQSRAALYGQSARASGNFNTAGDAQTSEVTMRNTTAAGTTPALLFLDGSSTKLVVPTNKSWAISGTVIGRIPNGVATYGGLNAIWKFEGAIKNINGTVSLIGSTFFYTISSNAIVTNGTTPLIKDSSWPGGSVAIGLGSANDFQIQVTGTSNGIVNWVAALKLTEVLI
jgi:hypothetical protein